MDPELDEAFREFSLKVFAQDRRVVESQRPEQIPLSLREEMHLRVPDAFALVYRRLLSDFGEEADRFLAP
jgi:phenylpropionate dioxygenase-like ring-hydroxylating dioxygenase large terminal subunit